MLIRMKTTAAGPSFSANPGDIVDRDDAEAQSMIDGGHAEALAPELVERMVEQAKAPAARRSKALAGKRQTR